MTHRVLRTEAAFVLFCLLSPAIAAADVEVEYIGHASFVVESPGGVRVVLDPFSSSRWLGYAYPRVDADVVLISHPHYDHDASYYWGDDVPVFREPGEYRVNDVTIRGIEGRHADPYGKDFDQVNTIWVIEAGGVRVAHLGDNGPLTAMQAEGIDRVDILMVPADGDDHILKPDAIAAAREALGDPLVVPMHYRLEGFHGLPRSLGPIDPWLEGQDGVVRLDTHRARLDASRRADRRVLVFPPSPELEAWPQDLVTAWSKLDEAREHVRRGDVGAEAAAALVKEAFALSPTIVFAFQWARALERAGSTAEAVQVLESALAKASRDDWEYRFRAHDLLGSLYGELGRVGDARAQFRVVLQGSHRTELLERARAFLAESQSSAN